MGMDNANTPFAQASDQLQSYPNPECHAQTCGSPGICTACGHSSESESESACSSSHGLKPIH